MQTDLWERGCERLATELPEQQFNTWIKPLPPADVTSAGEALLVGLRVPNRFKLDWIRSQYGARIEAALSELSGKTVRLEFSLLPRDAAGRAAATPAAAPAPAPEHAGARSTTATDARLRQPKAARCSAAAATAAHRLPRATGRPRRRPRTAADSTPR